MFESQAGSGQALALAESRVMQWQALPVGRAIELRGMNSVTSEVQCVGPRINHQCVCVWEGGGGAEPSSCQKTVLAMVFG